MNRVDIYKETKKFFKKNKFPVEPSIKYKTLDVKIVPKYQSRIYLRKEDMINRAIIEKYEGKNPILHNMADIYKPGGCVKEGSGAQEECCFRRSNYFQHLKKEFYPLMDTECVYSPNVYFNRQNEENKYKYIKGQYISCIAIPAIRFPSLDSTFEHFRENCDYELMKRKMEMVFKVAIKHNHNVIIISAFGCGAYGCPSGDVAQIMKECIVKYDGTYERLYISISGSHYNIFKELLNF